MTIARLWRGPGIIFVCFFLSGATGLVYQVLWLRMLGLVFGHTVYAITTVLAAFMAGLALGSFVFARRAARIGDLIRAYGWLEIGIGVSCALIPLLLWAVSFVYFGLHRSLGLSYDAFSLTQFVLVFGLLLVPTTLMGGTLPVLSQALVTDEAGLGRMVGALYAVNTLGAVVGTVLAGYALLPALGNHATAAVAAAGNLAVGALAIGYGRWLRAASPATSEPFPEAAPAEAGSVPAAPLSKRERRRLARQAVAAAGAPPALGAWITVAALGVSGAISLVYEVAWTRALALVIGSSTYAFTAMLVAFLVGIAGGSALYSWLWGARRASPAAFAVIQAAIGLAVALTVLSFERLPELFLVALGWSESPAFIQLVQLAVSASALLLSTLFIGATFPCAVAVAARSRVRVGRDVGQIYAINTLGAIVGTVLAGFVLIPTLGVHGALKVGVAANFLLAAALFAVSARPVRAWRWAGLGGAVAAAAGVLLIPPWDTRVMTSGPAVYGKAYLRTEVRSGLKEVLRRQQVLFYRDGISGTISVNQEGPHLFLRTNGKMDAGTAVDMPTQLMSAHLPLLIHPAPRSVLVIGMGSGITVGAVARHPVERVDVVEIEPAVVEATRFFAHVHGDVLADPRVRVVIADARNFLLTTAQRYDVIISEPSNPWIGGVASLFSIELFQHARQRLEPGGIMLQWIHGYSILPDDLRMVVNTFRTVFPAASLWNTIQGDFLLMGRTVPAPIDLDLLRARYQENPRVRQDLDRLGIRAWPGVLAYFLLGEADTRRYAAGARLNTDDRLPLEFSAPRALYLETAPLNWGLIRSFKTAMLPDVTPDSRRELERADFYYEVGLGSVSRQVPEDALAYFERALQLDPDHWVAALEIGAIRLAQGRPALALEVVRGVLARHPREPEALYLAGLALEALSVSDQAAAFFRDAVAVRPGRADYVAALRRVGGTP